MSTFPLRASGFGIRACKKSFQGRQTRQSWALSHITTTHLSYISICQTGKKLLTALTMTSRTLATRLILNRVFVQTIMLFSNDQADENIKDNFTAKKKLEKERPLLVHGRDDNNTKLLIYTCVEESFHKEHLL